MADYITDLVMKNKYSRSGLKLLSTKGIVMHYTANNGGTALNHADFFDGADGGAYRYAGAHIFIDRKEARLIIPLNEVAYHANETACRIADLKATTAGYPRGDANLTTIGIELCVEKDGSLHPDTYKRAVKVVAGLLKLKKLKTSQIYRHFDVTGKNCPAFWVKNPSGFTQFKKDVDKALKPVKPASKPVSESTVSPTASSKVAIGKAFILVDKLNVRASDSFTAKIVKVVTKGNGYQVYKESNGMYNVGGDQWISAGTKYVRFESYNNYVVSAGDTLWAIARNNKTTVNKIKLLNNLKTDSISVGQVLRLK